MTRKRYRKYPVLDLSGRCIGYEVPEKQIKIIECEKAQADRMWLSDVMPKYSETITLSLFHHYMRMAHPEVKVLISYADTTAGNKGTIYRAANYKLVDRLRADFYLLPSGERIHPVTMWHRHKTRAWAFLQRQYPGIVRVRDGEQLKFVKYL